MPIRKYTFLFLLLVLLPACIIPGCMVRHSLNINVVMGEPYPLDWLMRLATHEKQSSKQIIWRQGQSRFSANGTPEPINPARNRLYTSYANRVDNCCLSAVYKIPVGTFTVNAPRGSAIIDGDNTNVLRIFNADARSATALIESITLTLPQEAPREQIMEVIFYAFWVPLPSTARLEHFDPRPLTRSRDAFILPWIHGTRGRYRVVMEFPPGFLPDPADFVVQDAVPEVPEVDLVELPEEPPPNQDLAPDPPEQVAEEPLIDTDNDGYHDDMDLCPEEGDTGYGVGADGCPLQPDTDGDGIPNALDSCPNHGDVGYGIDSIGCPIAPDDDGDGVNNFWDYCPDDGDQGNGIDSVGCPIPGDSDGDGVLDDDDYCPVDGDQGAGVDELGCPIE